MTYVRKLIPGIFFSSGYHYRRIVSHSNLCNDIFFLSQILGFVLFAGGLFVRFGSSVLNQFVNDAITNLEKSLQSAGYGNVDISSNFSLSDVLLSVAIALIVFGLFLVILSMMGCCGGCYLIVALLVLVSIVSDDLVNYGELIHFKGQVTMSCLITNE